MTDTHTIVAQFTIPGEPAVKERPRFTTEQPSERSRFTRRRGRAYSTAAMRAAEANIGWRYRAAAGPGAPSADGLFGLVLRFYCGHNSRQDLDNAEKLIMDALNRVAYLDDRQVVKKDSELWRDDPDPRTDITIHRIERTR